jgi:hypothetical protein
MKHLNEYILELYVLNDTKMLENKQEIEEHLSECEGCRTLYDDMRGFYDELNSTIQEEPKVPLSAETALMRKSNYLQPHYEKFLPPMPFHPQSRLAKLYKFAKNHPIVVTFCSFAALTAFGWLLNDSIRQFSSTSKPADDDPDKFAYNLTTNHIEVKNKENVLLRSFPTATPDLAAELGRQKSGNYYTTSLDDLDGDGKKELITILPLIGDRVNNVLRIFAPDGKTIAERVFSEIKNYGTKANRSDNLLKNLLVVKFTPANHKGIFVTIHQNGPVSSLVRLDIQGSTLGEYWHYGNFTSYLYKTKNDSNEYVILCGQNNVDESKDIIYPIIIVLDPRKIIGKTQSSISPDFNLMHSNAELFCIRLAIPSSSKENECHTEYLGDIENGLTDAVSFWVKSEKSDILLRYEYVFTSDFKILQVKSPHENSKQIQESGNRKQEKSNSMVVNFNLLKRNVLYWDGANWTNNWSPVKYSLAKRGQ